MCFCFDGQGAVTSHRSESCRERGRADGVPPVQPSAFVGKPDPHDPASRPETLDAAGIPRA